MHPSLTAEPLSHVDAQSVRWLWEPYIPRAKLVLLDGDPSVGKSLLSIDIAARLSRGGTMPDGTPPGILGPHTILILNNEDGRKDTIRPRAEAAGADLDLVQSVRASAGSDIRLPRDIDALETLMLERYPDLVVIDSFLSFMPDVASNSYQSIHGALGLLADVAARNDCAFLLIRHLRKAANDNTLYRGLGSVGIIGAVRVGMLAASLPADPSQHVLSVTKCNLGPAPPALGYRLAKDDLGRGKIEWTGPIHCAADGLGVAAPKLLWPRDRAADWLLQQLAGGPVPAAEILRLAAKAAIPEKTLQRAKQLAKVKSHQKWLDTGQRVWYWYDASAPSPKDAPFSRPEDDLPPPEFAGD